jgi:outer membrane biosynthesis protein TonB
LLLSVILVPGLLAQKQASPAESKGTKSFKSSDACGCEFQIAAGIAEKLLIHKVEPVWKHLPMEGRVSGTVVVVIEIGKNGDVLFSKVISGPALLRKPVLDAVRKYKYKPYLLNGKAVEVETTVHVTTSNY